MSFRQDINAMRAWAVLFVLLFHFNIPGFEGGFLGVDIFFVISGFLMTAIIVSNLEGATFSIWRFYLARARRILPALLALILVLLFLGWFFLPTPDYKPLGSQAVSSIGFISNLHFWRAAGYFDAGAHEKWLLHTWSLSIEAQFYVLFPVFLTLLWRIRPKPSTIWWGLVALSVVSFGLSIFVTYWKPTAAFYALPTRGWELGAGGLALLISRKSDRLESLGKPLLLLGWLLWLGALLLISNSTPWPSGWALLPVAGTVALILAAKPTYLELNPVAHWLGSRSYSIYLWHWPVMVALYFADLQTDKLWVASGIGLSLLLGEASFRWIEVPSRRFLANTRFFRSVALLGLVSFTIALLGISVRLFTFDDRLSTAVEIAAAEAENRNPNRERCFEFAPTTGSPGCVFGDNPIGAILMGDSHALSTVSAIAKATEEYGKSVLFFGLSACPTLDGVWIASWRSGDRKRCYEFNEWVFREIESYPSSIPLILISRTSIYIEGPNELYRAQEADRPFVYFTREPRDNSCLSLREEFRSALVSAACRASRDRPVLLVRPYPEMDKNVPQTLSRSILFRGNSTDVRLPANHYRQRHRLVWEAQDEAERNCGVRILDPLPFLCTDEFCHGSRNGRPLYYDSNHLSEYGNKYLVPMFRMALEETWLHH